MNRFLFSDCDDIMDEIYECDWDEIPLMDKLRIQIHLFLCPDCSREARKLETVKNIMHLDFFPETSSFEECVMKRISAETEEEIFAEPAPEVPGWFSFRTWVVVGFFIFVSLATSFLWMDFVAVAFSSDSSFMTVLGITIGMILVGYGAMFIGSHLKVLSSHFNLEK